jgi:hypothetical protein
MEENILEEFSYEPLIWGHKGARFCEQLYARMSRREVAEEKQYQVRRLQVQ